MRNGNEACLTTTSTKSGHRSKPLVNCKISLKSTGLHEVFGRFCVVLFEGRPRHFTIEKIPQLWWSVRARKNWAALWGHPSHLPNRALSSAIFCLVLILGQIGVSVQISVTCMICLFGVTGVYWLVWMDGSFFPKAESTDQLLECLCEYRLQQTVCFHSDMNHL